MRGFFPYGDADKMRGEDVESLGEKLHLWQNALRLGAGRIVFRQCAALVIDTDAAGNINSL
jgi:hypothetical protein